jgi:hypothetical protein
LFLHARIVYNQYPCILIKGFLKKQPGNGLALIPKRSDSFLWWRDNSLEREGRKARPTPTDLRSVPAEVHAFESHPSHFLSLIRGERGEEHQLFDMSNLIRDEAGEEHISVLQPVKSHQMIYETGKF